MRRNKLGTLLYRAWPLLVASVVLLLAGCGRAEGTLFLPVQGSSQAAGPDGIDWLYYFVYWLCVFYFVHIMGAMAWFMWRYRRRPGVAPEPSPHHHLSLEVAWTVPPIVLTVMMFFWGFETYVDLVTPPADSYKIEVEGRKWSWTFRYPNGGISDELRVPVDRPVHLVMTSDDVIHSFYVPQFRVKQDVVPGRVTNVWFTATRPTIATGAAAEDSAHYWLFCAEYCGTQHSRMWARVHVYEDPAAFKEFEDGLTEDLPGDRLFAIHCASCHSLEGPILSAPNLGGIFGSERPQLDPATGEVRTVTADEAFIRESIVRPGALLSRVGGTAYPDGLMPRNFGQVLSEEELDRLVEFLKEN